jgi:hypothetical protein
VWGIDKLCLGSVSSYVGCHRYQRLMALSSQLSSSPDLVTERAGHHQTHGNPQELKAMLARFTELLRVCPSTQSQAASSKELPSSPSLATRLLTWLNLLCPIWVLYGSILKHGQMLLSTPSLCMSSILHCKLSVPVACIDRTGSSAPEAVVA